MKDNKRVLRYMMTFRMWREQLKTKYLRYTLLTENWNQLRELMINWKERSSSFNRISIRLRTSERDNNKLFTSQRM